MKNLILLCFLISTAMAGVSRDVFIRGKIGNEFNEKKVKVTDSLGQTYYLSRHLFPKNFDFKQGQQFAIEVDEAEVDKVKLLKK